MSTNAISTQRQNKAFLAALPDPESQLFHQHLHVFTLFPDLPKEIRLKIWHMCRGQKFQFGFAYSHFEIEQMHSSPITLRINHESRSETRKYYDVHEIVRETGNNGQKRFGFKYGFEGYPQFGFIDPGVDTVSISWWAEWDLYWILVDDPGNLLSIQGTHNGRYRGYRLRSPLRFSLSLGALKSIRYLQIRDDTLLESVRYYHVDRNVNNEALNISWLRHFSGLRELVIVGVRRPRQITQEELDICAKKAKQYFELEKSAHPEDEINVPEIIARFPTKLEEEARKQRRQSKKRAIKERKLRILA